jgi:hypothetical protein
MRHAETRLPRDDIRTISFVRWSVLRLAASSQRGAYLADSKMLFSGAVRSGGLFFEWAVPPRLAPEAVIMAAGRRTPYHPAQVRLAAPSGPFRKKRMTVADR